nr:hypothetical protein BgiMline_000563 [Biomphalaria glabrata]
MLCKMSALANETYASYDSKSNTILIADGDNQYRQRFQNMKLVVKELQDQLALYKNRCSGVDTVALMLKESKLEVLKLTRQCKALETAVANLQNRLSINGLPSSLNIEETERFVPGASKQTLDNLARENARLRSQLKSGDSQTGKKPEEILSNRDVDVLEYENKELKTKMDQLENIKVAIVKQYEEEISKISNEKKELEVQLTHYLHSHQTADASSPHRADVLDAECQTLDFHPNSIEEFRKSLKMFSSQCMKLDSDLENMLDSNFVIKSNLAASEKSSRISEENYADLEQRLKQVILMNQRWQAHNDSQEQQVHLLGARIAELEEINQELEKKIEMDRLQFEALQLENMRFKEDIDHLSRETLKRQQQQFDPSIVEILKQQIQVCTEDFNTERKDREQAVNRSKILQDENNRLNQEIVLLKQNIELLRASKHPLELNRSVTQAPLYQGQNMRFRARGDYVTQKLPQHLFPSNSYTGTSPAPSMSPVTSPVPMSLSSSNLSGDRSSSYALSSQENPFRAGPVFPVQRGHIARSEADYSSLPRSSRSSTPDSQLPSSTSQPSDNSNISMPMISRKSTGSKSKGDFLACPKCNQEYPEHELVAHIDKCKD